MDLTKIRYDANGLVPAIAQDVRTGKVLMQAYMNEEALKLTLETGFATYFSRSRNQLWKKGETSGNLQKVISVTADCDFDSILLKVEQTGPACHTGEQSCFFNMLLENEHRMNAEVLFFIADIVKDRKENPVDGSYTNYLFDHGVDKICKKVGEEATEVILGAKNRNRDELIYEVGDLFYHLTVLLEEQGVTYDEIFAELERRHYHPKVVK